MKRASERASENDDNGDAVDRLVGSGLGADKIHSDKGRFEGHCMRGFTYLDDESWLRRRVRWFERNVLARESAERPISDRQAATVANFIRDNFGAKIVAATTGTPFPAPLLPAIVCQETAYFWLDFMQTLAPSQVIARCVLDASGDVNGDRTAFPRNTAAFRARYGDEFSNLLIGEANDTRRLRGLGPKQWVYAGYGIFQYDLQYVTSDEAFFRDRQWYEIDQSFARVMDELKSKFELTRDLWEAVRAYNGSGPRAEQYKRNVKHYFAICERTWNATPPGS